MKIFFLTMLCALFLSTQAQGVESSTVTAKKAPSYFDSLQNDRTDWNNDSIFNFFTSIVERAKEIVKLVPEASAKKYIADALNHTLILFTDENDSTQIPIAENYFFLVLSDEQKNFIGKQDTTAISFFMFNWEHMVQEGDKIITANRSIYKYTDNMDGLACTLIHEIIHAMQTKILIDEGLSEHPSKYAVEKTAWDNHTYLYGLLHPDVYQVACDCETFRFFGPVPAPEYLCDPLAINFALYVSCKDAFLKDMYNPNK